MKRKVSPPRDQLNLLRQPLTRGERIVFDFFDAHLPSPWEIYIQPHLNGLRPDFVLLNPEVGIAVFEVKDWNLDAMDYFVNHENGEGPILMARKDSIEFSIQKQNPIVQVHHYREEIHELYCPRINRAAGFAAITAGVIFPFALDERVNTLCAPFLEQMGMAKFPKYSPVTGSRAIQEGNIASVFPEQARAYSKVMNPDLANDLRNWLVEPEFSSAQRTPLELDRNQRTLVTTRTRSGYRRIRGPAGSGKSLILAARAAQLISEGKEVLVITYNITLLHYLMDVAVRWPSSQGRTRQDVTWLNFHFWCKRVCKDTGHEKEYAALWGNNKSDAKSNAEHVLCYRLPELVSRIIDEDNDNQTQRYDAVLVDEGQDYQPSWWNVLRKVCRDGGEMLLVADATQDIYDTARAWTDEAMTGAGFAGGWSELKVSYRLPPTALNYVRRFAEQFLPKDSVNLPESAQGELDIYPCTLNWIQTSPVEAVASCQEAIFRIGQNTNPENFAIAEITFLTSTSKFGLQVVSAIGAKGVRAVHTFSEDRQDSRRRKMGFYMGDARVKATTLHSFKGWEARAMVIYIDQSAGKNSLALIYTGLTRLKRHTEGSFLTVVSSSIELEDYGRTWPAFEVIGC